MAGAALGRWEQRVGGVGAEGVVHAHNYGLHAYPRIADIIAHMMVERRMLADKTNTAILITLPSIVALPAALSRPPWAGCRGSDNLSVRSYRSSISGTPVCGDTPGSTAPYTSAPCAP